MVEATGTTGTTIGRRIRELRAMRGLSLRAAAELAGYSKSHLSRIERGEEPVERRSTVEAFATALGVSPADLTGQPFTPAGPGEVRSHSAVEDLRAVLRDVELGAVTLDSVGGRREPGELRHQVRRTTELSDSYRYDELGTVLPGVLARVWAHTGRVDGARELLIECLFQAFYMAKDLGYRDFAWSVAGHLHRAAEATDDPAWVAIAEYMRAEAVTGARSRERALELVTRTADALTPDTGTVTEAYGMLRLSAALHSAAAGAVDAVSEYVAEAADAASRVGSGTNFGGQHFGTENVAVWRVGLTVEIGDLERVPELARSVDVDALPLGRRTWFLMDLGRGLAASRGTRARAVAVLRRAEDSAPQLVRANPFVRETVIDLLARVPSGTTEAREVRGMAYRMKLGA